MEDPDVLTPDGISPPSAEVGQPSTPLQDSLPGEATPPNERSRTVPYGALAEERARRKELQRELQQSASARQRLQERLDALHTLARQPEPQDKQAAPNADVAEAPAIEGATTSTIAADEASRAFGAQVLQSVRNYATECPDFLEAYQHARRARVEELAGLGFTPDEALTITFENELEVINSAFATGRNPAQVIYDFAVRRGYRPSDGSQAAAVAGGASPSARPIDARPVMTEAEKIALAARGQAASKSLSAAGGGSTAPLTLEALADMSDEEFAEATKGDRWQRLLRM